MPSYREVVEILADLREILYPGYGRRQNLHLGNVGYHVGDLIDSLHDRLTQQIARALRHDCKASELETDFEAEAQLIAIRLLESIPALRKTLAEDVQAAFEGDPAAKNLDEIIFCYPGLAAITVFRIAHELHGLGVPLIPRMMTEYAHGKTGIDIHPGATIGRRFFIDHGTGVVIGETTHIGDGVKIYQGVTLGALSFPRDEDGQHPPERQAAPDHRGRGRHLRQRHDPRRQDGHRPSLRHRLLRLDHPQHPPLYHRHDREPHAPLPRHRLQSRGGHRARLSDLTHGRPRRPFARSIRPPGPSAGGVVPCLHPIDLIRKPYLHRDRQPRPHGMTLDPGEESSDRQFSQNQQLYLGTFFNYSLFSAPRRVYDGLRVTPSHPKRIEDVARKTGERSSGALLGSLAVRSWDRPSRLDARSRDVSFHRQ